jgi:hypothetical protein
MVIVVGTVSVVSAELLRTTHPGAVFYLTPFRMFELCVGALLTVIPRRRHLHQLWEQLAMIAGLSAVAYSVAYFDASTLARHFWLLLPCAGAALVIFAGNPPWSGWLLSNRLITAVGTISYSLYLVHWPIIVFYKYVHPAGITTGRKVLLVLLCVAMATLMYKTVELPFRSSRAGQMPQSVRTAALVAAVLALLIGTISGHAWYSKGWTFRVPSELRVLPSETAMWTERNPVARVGTCFVYEKASPSLDDEKCLRVDEGKPNYLIMGDSFAADAYVYLSEAYPNVNFLQATAGNCPPLIVSSGDAICTTLLGKMFSTFIPATKLDGVVLSAAWQWADLDALDRTIDLLKTKMPRVMLLGAGIRFPASVSALIYQSKRMTREGVEGDVGSHINPGEFALNDSMRKRFQAKVAAYIDVQSIQCEGHCRIFTQDGRMMYVDFGHLTLAGSRYVAPRIASRYGSIFPTSGRDGSKELIQ